MREPQLLMWKFLVIVAVAFPRIASARLAASARVAATAFETLAEVIEQCEADDTQNIKCVQTYLFNTAATPVSLGVEDVGPLVQGATQFESAKSPAPLMASATMELNITTSSGAVKTYKQPGVNYWNSSTSETLIAVHEHGTIQGKYGYMPVRSPRLSYAGIITYVNLLASKQAFYYKDWDAQCLTVNHEEYVVRRYFTSESGVTNTFVGVYSDAACSSKLSVSKKCTVYAGGIYYVVVSGDTISGARVSKFGESNNYCKSDDGDKKDNTQTIILVASIFGGIGLLVGIALVMAQIRKRQLRDLEAEELEKTKPPSQDEIQARMTMKASTSNKTTRAA